MSGAHTKEFSETKRGELYGILVEYAKQRASLPCQHSIYCNLVQEQMGISRTTFRTLWNQLVRNDQLVTVDQVTKCVSLTHATLTIGPALMVPINIDDDYR